MLILLTSRSIVRLVSSLLDDAFLIKLNYFAILTNYIVLVYSACRLLQCFISTIASQDIIKAKVALIPRMNLLTIKSLER